MRKICVVITARPSYSRIKTVLIAINNHPDLQLALVVTGSALLEKYGCVVDQIEHDGFKITARLFNVLEGNAPEISVKTTALAMHELATLFAQLKPDVVVTIADRFETLATAAAAAYMNIPLVHIQGGEITGNIDDKVRHSVTQLADFHFVATENAKARVMRMVNGQNNVYNTGCPSMDIAFEAAKNPELNFDPFKQYGGVGPTFNLNENYLVVMQHPVTTEYESSQGQIEITSRAITELAIPTFWFWPNSDPGSEALAKRIRTLRETEERSPIHFFKNIEPLHFLKLLQNAACLIGNSSTGIRECSFLGVPVVNIGGRQRGRERGLNVHDVRHNTAKILEAIAKQVSHGKYEPDYIYGKGNAGKKIAELLATISLHQDS